MVNYLNRNQPLLRGLWISSGAVIAAEIAACAGFDWLLLDGEHGLGGEDFMLHALRSLSGSRVCPIVRVPQVNSPLLGRVLDFGAGGIMVPGVKTLEDVRLCIDRMYYPPQGGRGLTSSCRAAGFGGGFAEYHAGANRDLALIIQIENRESVELADSIAELGGVDGLFIGHSDLSSNLGCFGDWENPLIKHAEQQVLDACFRYRKLAGLLLKPGQSPAPFVTRGFRMAALGSDTGLLKSGCSRLLQNTIQGEKK